MKIKIRMEKKSCMLILNIQSYNDIITNSSSEVVVRYDIDGVKKLKKLVESIIEPFTSLKFDDLFEVKYVYYSDDTDEGRYLSENEEDLEEILDKSWNRLYDGYTPSVTGISITPKEGKGMGTAARLLENIAYIFDTEVYYG